MSNVTWVQKDGSRISDDIAANGTLVEAAQRLGVPSVIGESGRSLSSATCYVVVNDA
jgi:hypothetical protein